MKSRLKLVLITLPLILIGVGFLIFVVANRPPPEQHPVSERTTAVRVIVARNQSVTPLATGFGIVRPARTYEAIAQVGGVAEYVNPLLKKGAILPAGAVLLRLSSADFKLAVAQARANIRAAEARLTELTVSESNVKAALAIEQEALVLDDREMERIEKLVASGTASRAAVDGARAKRLAQRQRVLNLESSLALLPTQRAVQNEQIAVYKVALETAELNLGRTELTLPFAARVASVSVEVGQFVRSGLTTAQLDGVEAAEVEAQVSVADMRSILQSPQADNQQLSFDPSAMTEILRGLGLSAKVRLQLGVTSVDWRATVERISDTIDQRTGTIGVIVLVTTAYSSADPGRRPPLTKGMFVEVTLNAPPVDGLVIPRSALRGGQVMLADSDNRLQLVPVSPHLVQGDIAVITQGLEPGMRVIVSAPSPMMAGMLLDVIEDTALTARLGDAGRPE
jgi:multidrug efflux pump subunit AcrA (membrane-fusion protein)